MYESFYRLRAEPFRLCPDAGFCFPHRSYAKARVYLQYAWYRGEGLAVVTGEPGTGKTTLASDLLADLQGRNAVVGRLVTTQLEAEDLLRMVALAFGVEVDGVPKARVHACVQDFLAEQQSQGRRALLVVDEAQDLVRSALEELRLLIDLERAGQHLLQVFLFGHPVLQHVLCQPELARLNERLIVECQLQPLDSQGTKSYVRHRMAEAGWVDDPRFEDEVFLLIHQASRGVPRRINLVCSRLLLHGYAEQQHALGAHDVRQVVEDLRSEMLLAAEIEEQQDVTVAGTDRGVRVAPARSAPASAPAVSGNDLAAVTTQGEPGKGDGESIQVWPAHRGPRTPTPRGSGPVPYASPMLPDRPQRTSTAGRTRSFGVLTAMQGLSRPTIELLSLAGLGGRGGRGRRAHAGRYVGIFLVAGLALGATYVAVPTVGGLAGSEGDTASSVDAARVTQGLAIPPRPQPALLHRFAQPSPSLASAKSTRATRLMSTTPSGNTRVQARNAKPIHLQAIDQVNGTPRRTSRQVRPDRGRAGPVQKAAAQERAEPKITVRQARQGEQVTRGSTAGKQLVADIQSRLSRAGHDPGPIDGISGPRTRSAIQAYQRDWGLAVDARATTELLRHLIEHRTN